MNTTRSVYLIRATEEKTAAQRVNELPEQIADISVGDFTHHDLSVEDAILLRANTELDFEVQAEIERRIASVIGDDVEEEEEEEEEA